MSFKGQVSRFQSFTALMVSQRPGFKVSGFQCKGKHQVSRSGLLAANSSSKKEIARRSGRL